MGLVETCRIAQWVFALMFATRNFSRAMQYQWLPRRPIFNRKLLSRAVSVAALLLLAGVVIAGTPVPATTVAPGKQATLSRLRGKKAVMHVYSFAPKTLEITSVTSRFFKDVDACDRAVGGALRAAAVQASHGDLVDAHCVAVDPAETLAHPEVAPWSNEVTML